MTIPIAQIPNYDQLYRRVHKQLIRNSKILPSFFKFNPEGEMSTDWSEHVTPEGSREMARVPSDNGIIAMNVGDVREITPLTVEHTPKNDHPAHADVIRDLDHEIELPQIRVFLSRISNWTIRFST